MSYITYVLHINMFLSTIYLHTDYMVIGYTVIELGLPNSYFKNFNIRLGSVKVGFLRTTNKLFLFPPFLFNIISLTSAGMSETKNKIDKVKRK